MRYRFGDCELDEDLRALRRGGARIRLQPKVFELLLFLILHRDRVVPKGVLVRSLWPDATVTRSSLTQVVKEARRAVGDDGHRQRVIQTVRGFGYRFAASVEAPDGARESEGQRRIELARRSLEASLDLGAQELRERVREFAHACLSAVERTREGARG